MRLWQQGTARAVPRRRLLRFDFHSPLSSSSFSTSVNPPPSPANPPPPSHTYKPEELQKEEGGYIYRYSYNNAGEATAW